MSDNPLSPIVAVSTELTGKVGVLDQTINKHREYAKAVWAGPTPICATGTDHVSSPTAFRLSSRSRSSPPGVFGSISISFCQAA